MEDFIRLNMSAFIGLSIFSVVTLLVYLAFRANLPKEHRPILFKCSIIFTGVFLVGLIVFFITQLSINNTPRNVIDRSYQSQSQQNYQDKVLKSTKEELK